MKLRSFISRLQELNANLEEFPPDTEGQETAPFSADEIIDNIYHCMPTTWKNKMTEKGFDCTDSTIKEKTDFFETGVENLESKKAKKKSSTALKKTKTRKNSRRVQSGIFFRASNK